ncbi:HprK-related kinase B [Qingshengfaniella alkalisoli]|uniref:HprK-related kinase B n=1 Tax=Qingshengfaniella alkalisoli TaxID=2599296 RepID=A0A5B8I9K8_9RHOB|nr:HprK-related kinase B [Qingshengfaniella alkalisoli]QDY70609.1 HprK-related kinase B [Qingshengfaniella alkalisoli]
MRVADVLNRLDFSPLDGVAPIFLSVGHLRLALVCGEVLRTELAEYFASAAAGPGPVDATVEVLEGQALEPQPDWIDWAREPGKSGRKDAYRDLTGGRLVHKVRTGVTFLQSPERLVAFGPCSRHPNQIINFVNTQFLNICQREGWQICHAAAITDCNKSLAIAGLSGGGKSTAVLRMMDIDGLSYVSNDRLLVRAGSPPAALGIPKLPRINPGTILTNPRLSPMLDATRQVELGALPQQNLWALEEKHDLHIDQVYGEGRIQWSAPLTHFWILNWHHGGNDPVQVTPCDLSDRPDLLSAIMKSAGPFYQNPDGTFLKDSDPLDPKAYLAALDGVAVYEVSGTVDFDALSAKGRDLWLG